MSNNEGLDMVPKPMRGNSTIILWIIGLYHANAMKLQEVEQTNRDMFKLLTDSGDGIKDVNKEIKKVTDRRTELLLERASVGTYLQLQELRRKCVIM